MQVDIANAVGSVLNDHPREVLAYRGGKKGVINFLVARVLAAVGGQASPQQVAETLRKRLEAHQSDPRPRLEDHRHGMPVGQVAYRLDAVSEPSALFFHQFANAAFVETLRSFETLQKTSVLGGSPNVIPAIGTWFLATESYLSTLFESTALLARAGYDAPHLLPRIEAARRIGDKFLVIEDTHATPASKDAHIHRRLDEFAAVRNMIFHARNPAPSHRFHHTSFASRIDQLNESDVVQAAIIAVEVFDYFRYIFKTADMMASLYVGLAVEKADVLLEEVILPAYSTILDALGMRSDLASSWTRHSVEPRAVIPIQFLIKAIPETHDQSPKQAPSQPLIVREVFDKAVAARPVDEDKFHVPSYMRAQAPPPS